MSESEQKQITTHFNIQKIAAKKNILKKGQICDFIAFVNKGCLVFYSKYNNKERVINFPVENTWIGDFESFFNKSPSNFYLKTLEDTELLTLSLEAFKALIDNYQNYAHYHIKSIHRMCLGVDERLAIMSSMSAEDKYNYVLAHLPDTVKRVPSKYLASYLGMEPPSLSRIKRKLIERTN